MKVSGMWVLLLTVSTLICLAFSIEARIPVSPGLVSKREVAERTTILKTTRRLKGGGSSSSAMKDEAVNADLEDYRPIDPSPSSKASIRPGPIQHGTPYIPYVPKLSPPPCSELGYSRQTGEDVIKV